jgi:hypothetical protein
VSEVIDAVIDAREIFRLLLACVLGFSMYRMGRGLRLPGAKVPFSVGYACIVASYLMSIVEDLSPSWAFIHIPQHSMFVVAGVAFAIAGWRVRSHPVPAGGAGS